MYNSPNLEGIRVKMILERDPVCGHVIKRIDIKDSSVYKGSRYYFCCPICKKMFDEKSEIYADKGEVESIKVNSPQLKLFN